MGFKQINLCRGVRFVVGALALRPCINLVQPQLALSATAASGTV